MNADRTYTSTLSSLLSSCLFFPSQSDGRRTNDKNCLNRHTAPRNLFILEHPYTRPSPLFAVKPVAAAAAAASVTPIQIMSPLNQISMALMAPIAP